MSGYHNFSAKQNLKISFLYFYSLSYVWTSDDFHGHYKNFEDFSALKPSSGTNFCFYFFLTNVKKDCFFIERLKP